MRLRIRDSSEPEGAQSWFPGLHLTPLGENWGTAPPQRLCSLHFPADFTNPSVACLWFRECLSDVRNSRQPTLGVCLEGRHWEESPVVILIKTLPLLYDPPQPIWGLSHLALLTSCVG